ncbi:MAG: hypothetical protein KIT16_05995 [Rhodospirillaceae bacterium]|nr:hypothetical protein [Rhodospirillaceae bacterium]
MVGEVKRAMIVASARRAGSGVTQLAILIAAGMGAFLRARASPQDSAKGETNAAAWVERPRWFRSAGRKSMISPARPHPPPAGSGTLARYGRERALERDLCRQGDCSLWRWRAFLRGLERVCRWRNCAP